MIRKLMCLAGWHNVEPCWEIYFNTFAFSTVCMRFWFICKNQSCDWRSGAQRYLIEQLPDHAHPTMRKL